MKTLNHSTLFATRKSILTVLLFGFINVVFCQSTFHKGYGNVYDCKLVASQETTDGNIIAAGTTFPGNIMISPNTVPGLRQRMCLIKTDADGDTIWTKTYGGTDYYRCNAMQQTMDNGFILAGTTFDTIIGDTKIVLLKTDSNGNMLWSQTYNSSDYNEELFAVKETPAGDYIMAGRGFVGKVNATGTMIWAKDLKSPGINLNLRSLDNTVDGGLIAGGSLDTSGSPSYAHLIKMNSSGNIIWSKTYNSIYNRYEQGNSVSQTYDKGFILTGATYYPVGPNAAQNHAYLVKTDSLGNLTWSKKFASDGNDTGYDGKQTADGGYIITGYSTGFVGNGLWTDNVFLIKTTANGNVNWCKYYGLVGNSGEVPASVSVMNSGAYLVSGTTTDDWGYPQRLYLLKTDLLGNVNCHGFSAPLFDSTYVSVEHAYNQPITSLSMTAANPGINQTHFTCNTYDACTIGATGLNDHLQKEIQVQVSPNPTNGELLISSESTISKARIEVVDNLGRIQLSQHQDELSHMTINISELASGIYFLKIYSGKQTVIKKIIKE